MNKKTLKSVVAPRETTLPTRLVLIPVAFVLTIASKTILADEVVRPNIIVIYTDDQGFGDASCLNPDSRFKTPNMDRLANEGISFTDAHCSDTVCTPSRYGLLTGRYSWRTSLKRGVFGAEKKCLIEDDRMTLASLLRNHGYHTAMVGKWHLGMDFPGETGSRDWTEPVLDMPLDKGFDYFFGVPASLNYGVLAWFEGRHAKVPPTLFTEKKSNRIALSDYRIRPPYQNSAEETKQVLGKQGMEVAPDFVDSECLTRFTDKAIEYITSKADDANNGKPFFLYLPYTSPHKPVIPLPEFRGQGEAGAYGEFLIETDHHIGQLLATLSKLELDQNTMIVFSSDNGPETTWKQRIEKFQHHSNGIYREGKRSVYEGGHRVPFFVRWPSGIKSPGRTCSKTICQTDVLATFAELVKAELPGNAGEDSESFLPALLDADASTPRSPVMHHGASGEFALRSGKWKLILPRRKSTGELYDLEADPSEKNNIAQNHPDIVSILKQQATELVVNGRTTPGARQLNDTGYWDDLTWINPEDYSP